MANTHMEATLAAREWTCHLGGGRTHSAVATAHREAAVAARELTWPIARPVVRRPNTKKGCALAWYLTSFLMGSGMKYLIWKNICTQPAMRQGDRR